MVSRIYLKDLITFEKVELEIDRGLIVFSGPSGAGKSVLMNAVLSSFGYRVAEAKLCEISLSKPLGLKSEAYELEDEVVVKSIKRDKIRYYLDNQNISKKALNCLFKPFVQYLSVRDKNRFKSSELINLIDSSLISKDKAFKKLLKEYKNRFNNYKLKLKELNKIKSDELRLAELIEFTTFEIEKIEAIDPKIGEDEELLKVKYQLSRIDKITDVLFQANRIFEFEDMVSEVYRLLDKDSSFFVETMNQLRADFEDIELLTEELSGVDIEEVLDRLERISYLKRRYGGIEEALDYVESKRKELDRYKNIKKDKTLLVQFLDIEFRELTTLADRITLARRKESLFLENELKSYLLKLKLPAVQFIFKNISIEEDGSDIVDLNLNGSTASTLSGGEFNRVRLALMVVSLSNIKDGGVLILDEIDANVSGDESIAIANMIYKLSSVYQIFAISHQAHLASKANQHILVAKKDGKSQAIPLDREGRVDEIARIIGGESPNQEAVLFATRLLIDLE